jgi:hypothetical protein
MIFQYARSNVAETQALLNLTSDEGDYQSSSAHTNVLPLPPLPGLPIVQV